MSFIIVILQAEEEMRQRVALIAKIRAIESVPVIRFKVFHFFLFVTAPLPTLYYIYEKVSYSRHKLMTLTLVPLIPYIQYEFSLQTSIANLLAVQFPTLRLLHNFPPIFHW